MAEYLSEGEREAKALAKALKGMRWTYDPSTANHEHEESELYDDEGRRVFGLHSYKLPVARFLDRVDPKFMLSVLDRLEESLKENEKLRGAITNYVDLSWLEEKDA